MPLYEHRGVRPTIGRDVFVADSATIIGDVVLGDESSAWFGVVIRGDYFPIRIGARTSIQDNSVLHITADETSTTVGDDVTVGHSCIIHGCTIGNRCLVGMGSIVLDAAVVGDDCFVAAGSLVTPGTIIPPRSMVMGRPARVVRPLREDDYTWIREAAELYVGYAREFRTRTRRIDG